MFPLLLALDVAAGEGRNAVWLATQGWQVTATDFSEVGQAKARALAEHAGVVIDTVHADATDPTEHPRGRLPSHSNLVGYCPASQAGTRGRSCRRSSPIPDTGSRTAYGLRSRRSTVWT